MALGSLQWLILQCSLLSLLWMPSLFASDSDWARRTGAWLDIPAAVDQVDVVVALGGDPARFPVAVGLQQAGLATGLWFTGATEGPYGGNSWQEERARQAMQEGSVPPTAVTFLVTANTWEDAQQIAATAKSNKVDSLLVVTSWYHGRRALCAVHHHLRDQPIQVFYQPVETPGFGPDDWWLSERGRKVVTDELYKILFYWGYYGLVPWIC